MIHLSREWLYFLLGAIPPIFFVLRMVTQWHASERKKISHVTSRFWKLSLAGNLTLLLHHLVQIQYPFALIQGINAVISWRNLNLMESKSPYSTRRVVIIGIGSCAAVTLLFLAQSFFLLGELDWIRTPQKPWDHVRNYHSIVLHLFGTVGGIVLSSRFWVQWWIAEKRRTSELDKTFWYLSLIGSGMMILYAILIGDFVLIAYNGFGLIPYLRNLSLIRKHSA